jgi:WD40 repeat protein
VISVNAESIILGGVWGGKLLCFDITNDKVETYSKHSDTITALTHCERSKLIASGSLNGEVIVWEYNNKMKVLYQNKMVHHYARINHISVEDELRILVSAGEDGLVVITNLFSGKLMRVLKFEESIGWAMCVSYPYTMIVILAGKKQLCYSINGQYIDEAEFDVQLKPQVYIQMGFQDRIIFKLEKEFVFLSLPDFRTESRYLPNR